MEDFLVLLFEKLSCSNGQIAKHWLEASQRHGMPVKSEGFRLDQFIAADKYVFVTPMYNLGFPAEFKMYIDAVCVVGKTFTYTPAGAVGLLKNQGRKCLHIHSNGGFHFGKEEDHSVPYLKSIMGFMGIENFESVVLEGVDAMPDLAEDYTVAAVIKARLAALSF